MTKDEMHEELGTARVVETWLDEGVQQLPERDVIPDDLLRRIVTDVEHAPQETRRRDWRARLGLTPGSDGDRRGTRRLTLAATVSVLVVAMLGLTYQAVLRPPTTEVGHFIVAADGNGFDTIAAAIAEAADGETILIRPGTYAEAIIVDKPVILKGDGPVGEIIIRAPADGPEYDPSSPHVEQPGRYAVLIDDADVSVSGVTLQGRSARVIVNGGAAALEGLVFDLDTDPPPDGLDRIGSDLIGLGSLVIDGGAKTTVRDSAFRGRGLVHVLDDSNPVIERNVFTGGFGIWAEFGDSAVLRGNRFIDASGSAVALLGPTAGRFEDNEISGSAIAIAPSSGYRGTGFAPVIADNILRGNTLGILMPAGSGGEIRGNEITASALAISLTDTQTVVADNELADNVRGIRVDGGSPRLEGNTITGGTSGLHLQGPSDPGLAGNTICDNEMNIEVTDGATRPDTTGNEVCPDSAS